MTFTVARAPLRVSLFGGGTDRPEFYKQHGPGEVLSFAIDKYMHVVLNKVDNQALKVSYSQIETVNSLPYLRHDIVRETWREYKLGFGWEVASFADLPTVGTGLGSSSSFACALVAALSQYTNTYLTPQEIAERACYIEMNLCRSPIGKQDQYAAAFGGFRHYTFNSDDLVEVKNIGNTLLSTDRELLESHLMLFYTGITRKTNEVLSQQKVEGDNVPVLKRMAQQVQQAIGAIYHRDYHELGDLLHEAWELKSSLPGVSNETLDAIYGAARSAGALGGKVLGAGGGGFMLFLVPPEKHDAVRAALDPLKETKFKIDFTGTQVMRRDVFQ